jgi:ERCC4-related helicase
MAENKMDMEDFKFPDEIEETKVEIPAKFKEIVESIEKMSVLDLNELVKLLEKK